MTPATGAHHVGSVLGERYELVRHVTGDGQREVYRGLDRVLQRPVVVQVYGAGGPADRSRFDAEVAGLLEDPSVQVYDAGEWSDDGGYVVVGDESVVGGEDPTAVIAVGGDTAVMPAVLQPRPPFDVDPHDDRAPASTAGGANRAVWLVLAAIALIVVVLASQSGGGIDAPTPTTEPVAVTSPPPSSTIPPTTATTEGAGERSGNGKGKGRGDKGDD